MKIKCNIFARTSDANNIEHDQTWRQKGSRKTFNINKKQGEEYLEQKSSPGEKPGHANLKPPEHYNSKDFLRSTAEK